MPRPRVHDDALRDRLLDEATAVVAEGGTRALTVRDVAARAGTSSSAVYSLFGGREALLAAVGARAAERFAGHLGSTRGTGDPAADLLALGVAYRRFALAEPQGYRVMFASPGAGAADPAGGPVTEEPTFRVLQDAVRAALAEGPAADAYGTRGADAEDATRAATHVWALAHGWVMLELDGLLPWPPDERDARYVAALRAAGPGLLAPPPV
ncbi:TetR/AcrR family transcriptional regulator [Cellulomonas sp.]|uniref:TetR/AcrR family transcriptional regulator n=1 Tax=Cellulomonas sp. TaxID=40001 RepID=UPI002810AEEB|nr:TetR/AcrR family transcriptional regulator [Cellulomonas sp.]